MQMNQITVVANDYAASVAFYRALGLRLIVDSPPRYARFECPVLPSQGPPATFSISQTNHSAPVTGHPAAYFETPDVDEVVAQMAAAGHTVASQPEDKSWLWREADLRDPAGNIIRIYWAGENRLNPPWRL